jgi:hypothetical protein
VAPPAHTLCRDALRPLAAAPRAITEAAADTSAPVRAACETLERAAQRTLADLARRSGTTFGPEEIGPIGQCLGAGRGAWVLEPVRLGVTRRRRYMQPGTTWELDGTWRVAYVTATGSIVRATDTHEVFHHDPSDEKPSVTLRSDWDGDGVAELMVRSTSSNFEGGGGVTYAAFLSFREGAIAPYAHGQGLERGTPVDADGDGRADLTVAGPYSTDGQCGSDTPQAYVGPTALAHSLADGRFSRDDEVSRGWYVRQCLSDAGWITLARNHDRPVMSVACERLAGLSAPTVRAHVQALGQQDGSELCPDAEALAPLIDPDPPVRIEACDDRAEARADGGR